jgi:hypothetical protein
MNTTNRGLIFALLAVFIIFVLLVPVYWSVSNGYPDGLDKLIERQNVESRGVPYRPPLSELQGYGSTMGLYVISGLVGALVVLLILVLVGRMLTRHRTSDGELPR